MKKGNLKHKLKKICATLVVTLAACLVFGANACLVVAAAEEVAPTNAVTISATSETLFEDGKDENKISVTKDADDADAKVTLPDESLVEDFENTLKVAETVFLPKIYLAVAAILMVALIIVGYAMLFLGA